LEVLLLLKDLQGLLSLLEHVLLFDKSLWSQRLLWLLGSKEKLLLELVQEQLLLGLILLVYFSRRVVLLLCQVLFLQQLENSLGIDEIYDVILVSSLIPRNLLVWSVPPIAVNSEFIHVFCRLQKFDERVSRWFHTYLLSKSRSRMWLSWNYGLHLFSLPIVELTADFDKLTSKRPLEAVLHLVDNIHVVRLARCWKHRTSHSLW